MSDDSTATVHDGEKGGIFSLVPAPGTPEFAVVLPLLDHLRRSSEATGRMRRSQFDAVSPPAGGALFLGDSITEQGLWSEWFPLVPLSNRGVGGDTVEQVAARLDSALNVPGLVSLLVGTNDLSSWEKVGDVDEIAIRFAALVSEIRRTAPDAHLLVNAVMPRTSALAETILRLNERYREIAEHSGATFVDTWSVLAAPDGSIRSDCSLDDLHLTGEGYRRWVELLRPLIESLGAPALHSSEARS